MQIGDRVKRSDVTEQSIPAFKALRGTVVMVSFGGCVRVHWDGDSEPEFGYRDDTTVCLEEDAPFFCAPSE